MRIRRSLYQQRTASAAVELAVCLPFLLVVVLGIWEVGRMVQVQQLVSNAAREGGRQVSAGQSSAATIQQFVANYLNMNGMSGVSSTNVTLTNITNSARNDPTSCNQLDQWRVTVTIPYSLIRWSTIAQITPTTNVSASADWYSMKDLPVSVTATIPPN